jgi:hypothetical protein
MHTDSLINQLCHHDLTEKPVSCLWDLLVIVLYNTHKARNRGQRKGVGQRQVGEVI